MAFDSLRSTAAAATRAAAHTDEALMLQVRDGNAAVLAELFERHQRPLFNYFLRLTSDRQQSEDLLQDVFFRILKYRETYRPQTSFTAWMYQVARNVHIDFRRRHRAETPWIEEAPEPESPDRPADEQMRKRQEVALVRKALSALPPDKREVLLLSRFQEMKYEQISEVLGCEVNTVKQRVFRAVRALGEKYDELVGGERR